MFLSKNIESGFGTNIRIEMKECSVVLKQLDLSEININVNYEDKKNSKDTQQNGNLVVSLTF
jgi:hypothetical protein